MSHALPRILPVYLQISCHIWLKRSTAPVYLRLACHIWLSIFLPSSPHTCVFVYSGVLSSWKRKVWLQSGVNYFWRKKSGASRISQGSIVSLGSPEFMWFTFRVAKCHRYDRYICLKIQEGWGKKCGRPHSFVKWRSFGVNSNNWFEVLSLNHFYLTEFSAFPPRSSKLS